MNTQLVEIQPRELKFQIEVKKQSTCTVHLANVTDQYVAFKVKTTSPKKYCVRPNVGIITPKSTCDFTVTMQAQRSAPPEMQCKDKFLIQSTVVPFGTTEEEITPAMFVKDGQKYIEETKLRVALTTAQNSPAKAPVDVVSKQEASYETFSPNEPPHSPVLLPVNGVIKQEPSYEMSKPKDKLQDEVENLPPHDMLSKNVEPITNVRNMEESRSLKVMESMKSSPVKDEEFYPKKDEGSEQVKDEEFYPKKNEGSEQVKDEEGKLKLTQDIEVLRSKITAMDSKLLEAYRTIHKLKEEKSSILREKETLKQELALSSTKRGTRKVQVGFPPLFVCMVALISLAIGFSFRA